MNQHCRKIVCESKVISSLALTYMCDKMIVECKACIYKNITEFTAYNFSKE